MSDDFDYAAYATNLSAARGDAPVPVGIDGQAFSQHLAQARTLNLSWADVAYDPKNHPKLHAKYVKGLDDASKSMNKADAAIRMGKHDEAQQHLQDARNSASVLPKGSRTEASGLGGIDRAIGAMGQAKASYGYNTQHAAKDASAAQVHMDSARPFMNTDRAQLTGSATPSGPSKAASDLSDAMDANDDLNDPNTGMGNRVAEYDRQDALASASMALPSDHPAQPHIDAARDAPSQFAGAHITAAMNAVKPGS